MHDLFKKLGLSGKETDVYIALLKLGKSTVEKIRKETHIERTHIYKILDRLEDKNFVTAIRENATKKFMAADPQGILKDLKNTEEEFTSFMPKLLSLKSNKPKAEIMITVYRGVDGLKRLGKELLTSITEYYVMGEQGMLENILPIYSKQFMRQLEENRIREKVLSKKGARIIKSKNTSVRYVPKEYNFPASTVIFSGNVIIVIWSEPMAIRIESNDVSESYMSQFNALWAVSRKG